MSSQSRLIGSVHASSTLSIVFRRHIASCNMRTINMCSCAVTHIHGTAVEFSPLTPWTAIHEAEEITLGLCVHQELQLYSSDLSFNSLLLEALGWRALQNMKKKNILSSVHEMGFIRDFVTAVDSVLNLLSPSCSSSQLPFPGPSSSRTYRQSTSTATLWRPTSSCATSALLVRRWNATAPLPLPQSARPVLRSILPRTGTGGIRANTAPRYVWGQ